MSGMEKWEHLMISFAHIKDATNDFENTIGKGGYGSVYQGELFINGRYIKVAVKRLNDQFGQGLKEFLTEIQLLSGQQHENIITLVGYCDEGDEKIIVYEYAEQGSLDQYIRPSHTNHSLSWLERLKIVAGAARGLDHLHNHVGEHKTVIHRDIKSSNILLDHNWVAKISDFGLSKLAFSGLGASTIISEACGTVNYLEPEYIRTGIVTKKTDVFSFGMVLFEVLCGRLCYIRDTDGILLLADVAKEYYANDKLDKIIDPILREQMSPESLKKYSAIAYKCLQDREHRPLMGVVKKELEETLKIQMGTYYNDGDSRLSEIYNSDIEVLGDDKKSFSDPLIQDDAPRSGNDNDDYVQITLDVSDDTVAVHRVKTVGGEDVENPELFLSKRQPVSRLDRTKSSAALALKELKFIGNNRNSWAEVERRFDVLTKVTDGLLPRSRFSECIGMTGSKEFAGVLFDALSRRRNITGDLINKAQLYEFWDQISDQSFDSRLQTFFDMINTDGDGRIKEDEVREIISLSASANKLSNIQQQADEYAALIMEELDPENLGYIMIENLEMLLLQASTQNVRGESRNLSAMSSQQLKMTRHKNPIRRWYEDFKNRK